MECDHSRPNILDRISMVRPSGSRSECYDLITTLVLTPLCIDENVKEREIVELVGEETTLRLSMARLHLLQRGYHNNNLGSLHRPASTLPLCQDPFYPLNSFSIIYPRSFGRLQTGSTKYTESDSFFAFVHLKFHAPVVFLSFLICRSRVFFSIFYRIFLSIERQTGWLRQTVQFHAKNFAFELRHL